MKDALKRDYEYLLWLLSRRDYPEKRLREKLRSRKLDPTDIDTLLEKLKDSGFFSEERFRKARARQLTRRGDGPRAIKAKVKSETGRDLTTDEMEEVYLDLGTTDFDVLRGYMEKELAKLKRSSQNLEPPAIKQKLIERAMRKGFGYDQIKRVLTELG